MKKLLLLLMFIPLIGFGQYTYPGVQFVTLDTMDVDTTFPLVISSNYAGEIYIKWGDLTGTLDGIIKIQASSSDSGLYVEDYCWMGTTETDYIDTIQSAYGYTRFTFDEMPMTKIRVLWDVNSITDGWLQGFIILRKP